VTTDLSINNDTRSSTRRPPNQAQIPWASNRAARSDWSPGAVGTMVLG